MRDRISTDDALYERLFRSRSRRACGAHPFSGGSGVLESGALSPNVALTAGSCCALAGVAALGILAHSGHERAAFIGVLILILAWGYSSPPLRLLARGLGECTTALVVGILVPLCAFAAQAHHLSVVVFLSTLPAACAMFIMMICVQIPDVEADAATGKRNLVVRFGLGATPAMIAAATGALLASTALAFLAGAPWTLCAAAVVPMPFCLTLLAALRPGHTRPQSWIAGTGVLIFVLTLSAGVAAYLV